MEGKENKKIYQKLCFWGLIIIVIIVLYIIINSYLENKRLEETFANIGNSASNFYNDTQTATSHLNDFSYNYSTGTVDYTPTITLDMYNQIKKDMTINEVTSVLGNGTKSTGENTYIISYGSSSMIDGYWIQIIFDIDTDTVISKSQVGL